MNTAFHSQLAFESLFSREVIAYFEGSRISADASGLFPRALDKRYQLAEKAVACMHDPRDLSKVKHDLFTLVRQSIFANPWLTKTTTMLRRWPETRLSRSRLADLRRVAATWPPNPLSADLRTR